MGKTFRSSLPEVEIPDVSLTSYVLRHVDERVDQPAMIDGPTGRVLTYGDLRDKIQQLAGGLRARGFAKGDVFAIMAPNVPEYAVAFHAVTTLGGTVTTINPSYTAGAVAHQLTDAQPLRVCYSD